MKTINDKAVEAAKDDANLAAFIVQYENLILKLASKTAKRYITKSDDEWSIALGAFSEAVKKYDYNRGSFTAFSELLIRQRLIDYFRIQGRHAVEHTVEFIEEDAIVTYPQDDLKLEIDALTQQIKAYGFSFMDLVAVSPKAQKTKLSCQKAVAYMLEQTLMIEHMRIKKQLPIQQIEKNTHIPRKILERHRKYIITVIEIKDGDYPKLAAYVTDNRKELLL